MHTLETLIESLFVRHTEHDGYIKQLIHEVKSLRSEVGRVMTTQAELAASLTTLATTLGGFKTELSNDITNLTIALANQGAMTPEVDAAMAALTGRVTDLGTTIQSVDALAPTPPAPPAAG